MIAVLREKVRHLLSAKTSAAARACLDGAHAAASAPEASDRTARLASNSSSTETSVSDISSGQCRS